MLHVATPTRAGSAPCVDVKALSAREPVLSNLFWAPWNELEGLACTLAAVVLQLTRFQEGLLVVLE